MKNASKARFIACFFHRQKSSCHRRWRTFVGKSAPGRNRTCDLALRRRALYPLSYGRLQLSLVIELARALRRVGAHQRQGERSSTPEGYRDLYVYGKDRK